MERTDRDSRQEEFLSEVQSWAGGHMTEEFGDPEGLRVAVTRQLHRLELSQQQVGAADPEEMQIRAMHLVPGDERNSSKDALVLAVAGGPRQSILRPTNIESSDLYDELLQQASFGQHRVFDTRHGTERVIRDDALGEIPDGSHVVIDLSHTPKVVKHHMRRSEPFPSTVFGMVR